MNTIPPEEERFCKNVKVMVGAIHEGVVRIQAQGIQTINPDLVKLAGAYIEGKDKHEVIQGFIRKSHMECWDNIKDRNEKFFLENVSKLFDFLPSNQVNLFQDLYLAKDADGNFVVPTSLKAQIWKLFDALIKISIKYIHRHRSPYSYQSNDKVVDAYGASFFDDVDLAHHADKWQVQLKFAAQC